MPVGGLLNYTAPRDPVEVSDLPAMLATLCCYESRFGPYHPHTLRLMVEVGVAHSQHGELAPARCLLERAARDLARSLSPEHQARLRAIEALRDLFIRQRDWDHAVAAQKELVECRTRRFGPDHRETLAARAELGSIVMDVPLTRAREV